MFILFHIVTKAPNLPKLILYRHAGREPKNSPFALSRITIEFGQYKNKIEFYKFIYKEN